MTVWCVCCGKTHVNWAGMWCKTCRGSAAWEALPQAQRTRHFTGVAKVKKANKKSNNKNNNKNNAKVVERNLQLQIKYQEEHEGVKTASDAEVAEGTAKAIEGIEEYRARQLELHPQGIAVGIYVVSSGSVTIEREGELQVYTRGLQAGKPAVPSIRDIDRAHPHVIPKTEINAHADPGVAIFNVEFDRAYAKKVETRCHEHYIPAAEESQTEVSLQLRKGAGKPQGRGPFILCARAFPLPLPHGWSIRTTPWVSVAHARATDVCQGGTVKGGVQPGPPAAARGADSHSGQADLRRFFQPVKPSYPKPSKKQRR